MIIPHRRPNGNFFRLKSSFSLILFGLVAQVSIIYVGGEQAFAPFADLFISRAYRILPARVNIIPLNPHGRRLKPLYMSTGKQDVLIFRIMVIRVTVPFVRSSFIALIGPEAGAFIIRPCAGMRPLTERLRIKFVTLIGQEGYI